MWLRGFISAILALAVAFGLFTLMQSLVDLSRYEVNKEARGVSVDFVRAKHESMTETKKRALPEKQKVDRQPTAPKLDLPRSSGSGTGVAVRFDTAAPVAEQKLRLTGGLHMGGAPADSGTIPLVRIQPMYPRNAAERRIEGWVRLEFTISKTGTVKNARVIDAQPPHIFNRAALDAIRKWKYKPTIVNGVAMETPGIQVQLTFKLDEM
jgi:protein TonB